MKYNFDMNDNKYLTPPVLYQKGLSIVSKYFNRTIIKYDLDVCCSQKNIPAERYFLDGVVDGLKTNWDNINWCNPPFNISNKWVKKAFEQQYLGKTTVMLIPVRTETAYWHDYILFNPNVDIHWLRKGPKFLNSETGEEMGVFKNPLALVLFKGWKNEDSNSR